MHSATTSIRRDKIKNNCVVFIFMLFMIMKSDINKLVCILFVLLSSTSLEHFKDHVSIIPEILELIKLNTYKFGPVYVVDCTLFSRSQDNLLCHCWRTDIYTSVGAIKS